MTPWETEKLSQFHNMVQLQCTFNTQSHFMLHEHLKMALAAVERATRTWKNWAMCFFFLFSSPCHESRHFRDCAQCTWQKKKVEWIPSGVCFSKMFYRSGNKTLFRVLVHSHSGCDAIHKLPCPNVCTLFPGYIKKSRQSRESILWVFTWARY